MFRESLYYYGAVRLNIDRVQPGSDFFCRLSVLANVLNFFSGQKLYSPEQVLELINQDRAVESKTLINPQSDTVSDEDVRFFIDRYGEGLAVTELAGSKFLQLDLWDELISAGFIIAPNHQLFYWEPSDVINTTIAYFPKDLLDEISKIDHFSYPLFRRLMQHYFNLVGEIDTGHYDLVLDVKPIEGVPSLILANLSPYEDTVYPLQLPWGFFIHTAFDGDPIKEMALLPDETEMVQLLSLGKSEKADATYYYGAFEIFYPKEQRQVLEQILLKFKYG